MNLNECFLSLDLAPMATIDDVNKAYKRLISQWHPDRHQADAKQRQRAEQKTKEINAARDFLVGHIKELKNGNGQKTEARRFSVNFGQVSAFISEFCSYSTSESTERLDLYMAYRDWCYERHLCPLSNADFERTVISQGFTLSKVKSGAAETLCWLGIKLPGSWYFLNDPNNHFIAYAPELDPNYSEPQKYADMDDDDDMGEVIF